MPPRLRQNTMESISGTSDAHATARFHITFVVRPTMKSSGHAMTIAMAISLRSPVAPSKRCSPSRNFP